MKKLLVLIISFSLLLTGCSLPTNENKNKNLGRQAAPVFEDDSSATNTSNSKFSLYTGESLTSDEILQSPFMAIIENSVAARPQSGLAAADIIYETMAEGGIPRFVAIYQKENPKKIGPIRSARPYFLDISREYSLPLAHCGGSEEALNEIQSTPDLMSLNEIKNGSYFWRDTNKKSPHNLFTSAEKVRKFIKDTTLKVNALTKLSFDEKAFDSTDLEKGEKIDMKLSPTYKTDYTYKNQKYEKTMDGKPAIDADSNDILSFKNVVVQVTSIKLQSDKVHLDIDLVGKGDGMVFSEGKYKKVTWSKKDKNSPTELLDDSGNKVALTPGKTIWHIVDKSCTINFK